MRENVENERGNKNVRRGTIALSLMRLEAAAKTDDSIAQTGLCGLISGCDKMGNPLSSLSASLFTLQTDMKEIIATELFRRQEESGTGPRELEQSHAIVIVFPFSILAWF